MFFVTIRCCKKREPGLIKKVLAAVALLPFSVDVQIEVVHSNPRNILGKKLSPYIRISYENRNNLRALAESLEHIATVVVMTRVEVRPKKNPKKDEKQ